MAGPAGWDQTAYTYTPAQQLSGITDAAGNQWAYGYNLAGDQTTASDPDTGNTAATHDGDGNLLSATSADASTVSYVYDKDGRKTAEYAAPVADQSPSSQLASWVYDTLAKGQLTSATSYTGGSGTGGQAYTQQSLGYTTSAGLPKGTETTIPSGPLAGTYITADSYTPSGQLDKYADSAAARGLPGELLAKQRCRRATLGLPGRLVGYLLDGVVGYGYRPGRAFAWLVALMVAGSFFYLQPTSTN